MLTEDEWRGYSAEAQEWADLVAGTLGDPIWTVVD
jgi:hypothetical protein